MKVAAMHLIKTDSENTNSPNIIDAGIELSLMIIKSSKCQIC